KAKAAKIKGLYRFLRRTIKTRTASSTVCDWRVHQLYPWQSAAEPIIIYLPWSVCLERAMLSENSDFRRRQMNLQLSSTTCSLMFVYPKLDFLASSIVIEVSLCA